MHRLPKVVTCAANTALRSDGSAITGCPQRRQLHSRLGPDAGSTHLDLDHPQALAGGATVSNGLVFAKYAWTR